MQKQKPRPLILCTVRWTADSPTCEMILFSVKEWAAGKSASLHRVHTRKPVGLWSCYGWVTLSLTATTWIHTAHHESSLRTQEPISRDISATLPSCALNEVSPAFPPCGFCAFFIHCGRLLCGPSQYPRWQLLMLMFCICLKWSVPNPKFLIFYYF